MVSSLLGVMSRWRSVRSFRLRIQSSLPLSVWRTSATGFDVSEAHEG
jgi:hypothetical protein